MFNCLTLYLPAQTEAKHSLGFCVTSSGASLVGFPRALHCRLARHMLRTQASTLVIDVTSQSSQLFSKAPCSLRFALGDGVKLAK